MDGKDGPYLCSLYFKRNFGNVFNLTGQEQMKKVFLLFSIAASAAPQVIPNFFTQGSMQSTTTTTIDIDRTIETEVYGGVYKAWSGTNVTPSGSIDNSATTFSVTTAGDPFQLEIVDRAAGIVETIDINETIEQVSTTTSLSVFSQ